MKTEQEKPMTDAIRFSLTLINKRANYNFSIGNANQLKLFFSLITKLN